MARRVVILGGGESGTGAALLAKVKGNEVFVSDQGMLKEKYKQELIIEDIPFEEGQHSFEKILNAELIIKSPGIPDKAEVIKKAKENKIEVIDELEFAYRYIKQGRVIAVTGTNGKTTTTLLTYHLMKSAGMSVALAGNVGESLARKVAKGNHDWYVVEISSFQLDGTKTFRPHIGILLNITPDHLDRYEYEMQNYVNSKFRLIQSMQASDYFIYFSDDKVIEDEISKREIAPEQIRVALNNNKAEAHFDGRVMVFDLDKQLFNFHQQDTTLKGPHNLINTMSAVSAVYTAGVSMESIKQGLKTFRNAPHRLESVATIKGIEFVNDSKATNVDSVVYALGSYKGSLIWIAGGIDKGNDYSKISDEVKKKVRILICLGKDNEKLHNAFEGTVPVIFDTQSIEEVVGLAWRASEPGDVVLLSPACASFDLFKNYEDRGDQFREAVLELKKENELTQEIGASR